MCTCLQLKLTYRDVTSSSDGYTFVMPVLHNFAENQTSAIEQLAPDTPHEPLMNNAKVTVVM